jgi:hypothetical protein
VNAVTSGCLNPASIAWTDGFLLAGEYNDLGVDDSDDEGTGSGRLSSGTQVSSEWRVAGLVGYLSAANLSTSAPPEEPVSSENDQMLTYLGAASWTRGAASIAAGVAAKHLQLHDVDFVGTDLGGWVFDVGVLTAFSLHPDWGLVRPRVGLATTNLDTGWEEDYVRYAIEGEYRLAVGVDIASRTTALGGRTVPIVAGSVDLDEFTRSDESGWHLSTGVELSILNLVQARIGHDDDPSAMAYGFGLGWAFGRWMVRGDYAHESWSTYPFGDQHSDIYGVAAGVQL